MSFDKNDLSENLRDTETFGHRIVSFPKSKAKRLVLFESQPDLTVDEWMDQIMDAMKEIYNDPALQKEIAKRQS